MSGAEGKVLIRVAMFVDISSSTRLYKELGDALAVDRVHRCVDQLCRIVKARGGRVIKNLGDGVMCDFAGADQALLAAEAMHIAVSAEAGEQTTMNIHIGCHLGQVIENNGDLFGDTVNVAARIAGVAGAGKIITTQQTVDALDPLHRVKVRPLYQVSVKGHADPVAVFEYMWGEHGDLTIIAGRVGQGASGVRARLRLACGDVEVWLDQTSKPSVLVLGRQPGCEFTVSDPAASRRHATIEMRGDKFVLVDHSANGTYVAWEAAETCLKREEMILPARGSLGLGASTSAEGTTVLAFSRES